MNQLFNYQPIDFANEPLFLGSGRNIARLDLPIQQRIQKLTDDAMGLIWFKGDFSYVKDGKDYARMSKAKQLLYLKNLKFQTLLDSLAARSVAEVFLPITTNPQLENWFYFHAMTESTIHSATYAEIIKALPVDAKAIFDDIMINSNILDRARELVSIFEETVQYNARRILNIDYDKQTHMRLIIKSVYALNILEAVLFKSSFITSFAYKENGLMDASGSAIRKIQLDEVMHYSMTNLILSQLKRSSEWKPLIQELEPTVINMYLSARKADHVWIDYLLPDDKLVLPGINNTILKGYVDYNLDTVTKSVGIGKLIGDTSNPAPWSNKYTKSSNMQTASKEKDNSNYLLGKLDSDLPADFWSNLP